MRPNRFMCGGCNRSEKNKTAVQYCVECHTQHYRIMRLIALILIRYPRLKGAWISDILIRMWMKHVESEPQHYQAAEKLLNSKPEQLTLW